MYYISLDRNASAITRYGFRYTSTKDLWGLRYDLLSDIDNIV